ncbi:MAG: serine/threonine protein kinase [Ruminococcaceae bacterium]|nr:serine/threonine protein kinase [Oscillospiraceae bacterium]
MSEIKDYIDTALNDAYTKTQVLRDTSVNTIVCYEKNDTAQKLIYIKSAYRNDEVFRKLKNIDTMSFVPMIYEVSSEDDYLYVLEEYIEGKSLADYLSEQKQFSKAEIKSILCDLCDALQILHGLGIVHRDIKPENVIIRGGKACLIDLSIAKLINPSGNDTRYLGTAGYAAPEQYGISQSLPTADIYALGVLANILAIGTHPTSDVPRGNIGRIIKKCTDIQTSKRYQSASELKKAVLKI